MHVTDDYTGLECETCDSPIDPLDADESGTPRCHLCGITFVLDTGPAAHRVSA